MKKGAERVGPHNTLITAYEREWLHNERIFIPLINYNIAYLLIAAEQKIVPREAAAALVSCLVKLLGEGFSSLPYSPERDGLQPNLEAEVTKRIGAEYAGWLSVGRARQECELVARQIVERNELLDILEKAACLLEALIGLASREIDALMPYYTWAQHAEPITFGYFMAANANAVAVDCVRLEQAFVSLDKARAGAGQVVPPPFDIDREKLAKLLGFSVILPNSLYAYSSLDIEIQLLSALAIFCSNLARLAETLFVWASPEFGFLQFGAEFTGASYAMPQKKNPYALRLARPVAARAAGILNEAIQLHTGSLQIVGNGLIHIPNRVIEVMVEVAVLCDVLSAALPTISLNPVRMREALKTGWAQAPQLVYFLMQIPNISFRQAHSICGRVVREAKEGIASPALTSGLIEISVAEATGQRIEIDMNELRATLESEAGIRSRTNGGPAPESVRKEIVCLSQILETRRDHVRNKRQQLAAAAMTIQYKRDRILIDFFN